MTKIKQLEDEKSEKFLIAKDFEETQKNLNRAFSNLEVAKDKIRRMQMSFSWKQVFYFKPIRYKVHLRKQEP